MSYRNGSRVSASSILLRQPHAKLRVALVCLVWGEEFADFFAHYCVRSLLEPHNIPLVAREQDVTLLLYTDRPTRDFLERCDSFNALSEFVKVEVLQLEQLPATARTNHWVPWQHAVAGRNRDFDSFLVIIPDCVYAAGSLGTIIAALEDHDAVYGTVPQVCRETVVGELEGLRRVDDHEYISFTSLQAVELFIRHVNPKHAAAACSGTFFLAHPELALALSPESMVVSEISSHPLAVRSSARSISYTFDALSPGAKPCYLEILGVSAEPTLKFVEQYYRWPKLHRDHSRLMNLASWASIFRDASNAAYSRSATHIALDQGRVLGQHRGEVTRAKTNFVNATLDYLAVSTRVCERARQCADTTAARYVALATAAPGFHRRLRRLQSDLTVVLPRTESRFEDVVEGIEGRPAAQEMLRRFLFLHVVAGRLPIVPGQVVFLTYSDTDEHFPKAFIVDPHTVALGGGLLGKAVSPLQWVWENVFCIEADIDYSQLTWSMLDPVNGTSERVLQHCEATGAKGDAGELHNSSACAEDAGELHNRSAWAKHAALRIATAGASRTASVARGIGKFSVAKTRPMATRLSLLHQSASGVARQGEWQLRAGCASVRDRFLRLAKRAAPRPYEIARTRYRSVRPRRLTQPLPSVPLPLPRPPPLPLPLSDEVPDSNDAIAKLNIVENVAKVTLAFYDRLGLSPQQSAVCRCLASMRAELAEEVEARGAVPTECSLERFELAWRAYAAGETHQALQLFREVIADEQLAQASASDARSREAFIRAAEILGHHAELRGDAGAADQLYRRILELDGNGIVARRLLLMLWRQGRLREAAELAPRILQSDRNLAQHLRGSDAVGDLTRRLKREARREPMTMRGQNARDFGLQVG
jgi:tetratricopeptide (TPR) repeat protein